MTTRDNEPASYVCWQSGSAEVDGQTFTFVRGQRLRGDDPGVRAVPQFFVPDGTPTDRMPHPWDEVVERNQAEQPAGPAADVFLVAEPMPLEREDDGELGFSVGVRFPAATYRRAGGPRSRRRWEAGDGCEPKRLAAGQSLPVDGRDLRAEAVHLVHVRRVDQAL